MQSEQQYLSQYDPSQFEHPSVTVDILIFTVKDRKLHLLLIRRNEHPFMGKWAIPGGFLRMDESADEAAARRIREETGVENIHLEQLYTFSSVDRDPRTRVLSIAYLAAVPYGRLRFQAGEGADEAGLFAVDGVSGESVTARPEKELSAAAGSLRLTGAENEVITGDDLAFDHEKIIRTAVQRMRGKLGYTDLAFGFSFMRQYWAGSLISAISAAPSSGNTRRPDGSASAGWKKAASGALPCSTALTAPLCGI